MRLSDGSEIDCTGNPVQFSDVAQEATVWWFMTRDAAGNDVDDDKLHVVRYEWARVYDYYDVKLLGWDGAEPTAEMLAHFEDYVLASIPGAAS